MLLFVKKKYVDQIKRGEKTFELRAGKRYRNITAGDELLINGNQLSLRVTKTAAFPTLESAATATGIDVDELRTLYPNAEAPFYAFYFDKPKRSGYNVVQMRLAG